MPDHGTVVRRRSGAQHVEQKTGSVDHVVKRLPMVIFTTVVWTSVAYAVHVYLAQRFLALGLAWASSYGFALSLNLIGMMLTLVDKMCAVYGLWRIDNWVWFVGAFVGSGVLSSVTCYIVGHKTRPAYLWIHMCNVLFALLWHILVPVYFQVLFADAIRNWVKDEV
mmetsp:Transcript_721/g.1743  ORF Transcript_721/g.1743 Transcript_721/m.1743 type:complete len:166 (-) Transcript_721:129-626(-)